MKKILVLHGPNLNLLGTREPGVYGTDTLAGIDAGLEAQALAAGAEVSCLQSNSEATLIDWIHAARPDGTTFIVINPAGLTHTSVALRDALAAVQIPCIEVHLSNIYARETFRQHSYISPIVLGTIGGLGAAGYHLALTYALQHARG